MNRPLGVMTRPTVSQTKSPAGSMNAVCMSALPKERRPSSSARSWSCSQADVAGHRVDHTDDRHRAGFEEVAFQRDGESVRLEARSTLQHQVDLRPLVPGEPQLDV